MVRRGLELCPSSPFSPTRFAHLACLCDAAHMNLNPDSMVFKQKTRKLITISPRQIAFSRTLTPSLRSPETGKSTPRTRPSTSPTTSLHSGMPV